MHLETFTNPFLNMLKLALFTLLQSSSSSFLISAFYKTKCYCPLQPTSTCPDSCCQDIKAALINIVISTMNEMAKFKVKGVTYSDEPTENYPTLQFPFSSMK